MHPDNRASLVPSIIATDSARYKDALIEALQAEEIGDVRKILKNIPKRLLKATLLSPSLKMEHKLQTPLMAGAATGNISAVGAVLASVEDLFIIGDGDKKETELRRKKEMKRQMEIIDVDDMTLLMHASCSGSAAMFNIVANEIQRAQFRKVLTQQDANGMTFLHHAINGNSDELVNPATGVTFTRGTPRTTPLQRPTERPTTFTPGARYPAGQAFPNATANRGPLDSWVPIVKSALKLAKTSLWGPEYRRQLLVRDAWGRSALEHALTSGRSQVFEVVYDAMREDIYDDEIDLIIDPGETAVHGENALRTALKSTGGQKVQHLLAEKASGLKSDISLRAQDSTVASKIQSFVPGNLIVIFQLLLPETGAGGNGPLILLALLCFVAPFWSWGSTLGLGKGDPTLKNTRARQTAAKYILAGPAMFLWGISTSTIGEVSFDMSETLSAAALAVGTIVLPALDSYFSGGGARQTSSKVVIAALDIWDVTGKIFWNRPMSKIAQSLQLHDDEEPARRMSSWMQKLRRSSSLDVPRGSLESLPLPTDVTEAEKTRALWDRNGSTALPPAAEERGTTQTPPDTVWWASKT